jgi:hypothetical protein
MADDDEHDSSDGSNAPSLKISSSSPTTTAALSTGPAVTPIFNSLNDFADEEDENNDSSAHPLLSSIKKKVKIGSFSIRYHPRQKQHGQYYSPAKGSSSSSSQFHDFTPHEYLIRSTTTTTAAAAAFILLPHSLLFVSSTNYNTSPTNISSHYEYSSSHSTWHSPFPAFGS